VGKRTVDKDRKARVEAMRRAEQAKERRRTMLVLGAAVVVVVILAGLVVAAILDFRRENDIAAVGVPAAEASCDDVVTETADGVNEHVETPVEYTSSPPMFGAHRPAPVFPNNAFYSAEDRPELEQLVHNLEHGYTILWYAEDLPEAQVEEIRRIASLARDESATGGKFIAVAWDASRGEMPDGRTVALSHWGAEDGARQYCGGVSGEVVRDFVTDWPASNSPEPNAA
jgi:hypothetical protein